MTRLKRICLIALCCTGFIKATAQTEATWYTSMGSFKVILTDTLTPITVDSFIARVSEKFYDGTIFHRVIDNFMIQGGDPLGTGFGGPGYTIPDEFHPTLKNVPKALAMANAGPNTGGSQFFINLVTNNHLNNVHTVFGMVSLNFSVVQDIGHVPTDANDRPLTDVVLDSIRITQFPTVIACPGDQVPLRIYPNPCRGMFGIDLPGMATKLEIVNMAGQTLYAVTAKDLLKVDFRHHPAGLYIVRIENARGSAVQRLIVQ